MAGTGGHRTDDELLITRTQLVSVEESGLRLDSLASEGGLPGRDRPRIVDDASCTSSVSISADFVLVIK